jgi:hypothetical protein
MLFTLLFFHPALNLPTHQAPLGRPTVPLLAYLDPGRWRERLTDPTEGVKLVWRLGFLARHLSLAE